MIRTIALLAIAFMLIGMHSARAALVHGVNETDLLIASSGETLPSGVITEASLGGNGVLSSVSVSDDDSIPVVNSISLITSDGGCLYTPQSVGISQRPCEFVEIGSGPGSPSPLPLSYVQRVPPPNGSVPEPSTLLIWCLLGILGIAGGQWQRRRAA